MKKLFLIVVCLSCSGCACTGAKIAVRHTQWDNRTPTTIEVETDIKF